jgi:tetratricopeptide (TPR) repeat protein
MHSEVAVSSEDVRVLTSQLAADPSSLVFLPLGEALRRRGQLDAAQKVAIAGLTRYPDLADAHDLLARVLGDRGDLERAFDEWDIALRLDPGHAGSHKGIGFLYFVAGDLQQALDHLEAARAANPEEEGLDAAIARVRESIAAGGQAAASAPGAGALPADAGREDEQATRLPEPAVGGTPMPALFEGLEGADDGLLLLDAKGLRLAGGLKAPGGTQVGDAVAAHLAGVFKDASRAVRLLGLGGWRSVAAESADANFYLAAPTPETLLLLSRDPGVPIGRLARLADRAAETARAWLEGPA